MGDIYTAEQFIKAMPGTGGIVTLIANKVGCTWHTCRKWIDRHPTVREAWDAECEAILDLAESKAIGAIKKGDAQMVRWYLSTKGKQRGYTERHEITGADGKALKLKWDDGTDVAPFASGAEGSLE